MVDGEGGSSTSMLMFMLNVDVAGDRGLDGE